MIFKKSVFYEFQVINAHGLQFTCTDPQFTLAIILLTILLNHFTNRAYCSKSSYAPAFHFSRYYIYTINTLYFKNGTFFEATPATPHAPITSDKFSPLTFNFYSNRYPFYFTTYLTVSVSSPGLVAGICSSVILSFHNLFSIVRAEFYFRTRTYVFVSLYFLFTYIYAV